MVLTSPRRSCAALVLLGSLLGPLIGEVGAAAPSAAMTQPAAHSKTRSIALGFDVPHSGSNHSQLDALESTIGRNVAVTREFLSWDSAFPTSYDTYLASHGTVPIVSVKSRLNNGAGVTFASVAKAPVGSALYNQMVSWATRMKSYGHPVYFDYNHEPEAAGSHSLGGSADFVAAWRRLHDIFVAQHATNVRFMWIMTSWSFRVGSSDARQAIKWYPGDAYVDAASADGYNWSDCRSAGVWTGMSTIMSGFIAFGAAHPALTLWMTEFASIEDPQTPGRKAAWINDVRSLLKQPAYAQVAGMSWFNETQTIYPKCNWPITTSASATAAMKALADDPYFSGSAGWTS
jgi:Glycosyl hydrolase family 26